MTCIGGWPCCSREWLAVHYDPTGTGGTRLALIAAEDGTIIWDSDSLMSANRQSTGLVINSRREVISGTRFFNSRGVLRRTFTSTLAFAAGAAWNPATKFPRELVVDGLDQVYCLMPDDATYMRGLQFSADGQTNQEYYIINAGVPTGGDSLRAIALEHPNSSDGNLLVAGIYLQTGTPGAHAWSWDMTYYPPATKLWENNVDYYSYSGGGVFVGHTGNISKTTGLAVKANSIGQTIMAINITGPTVGQSILALGAGGAPSWTTSAAWIPQSDGLISQLVLGYHDKFYVNIPDSLGVSLIKFKSDANVDHGASVKLWEKTTTDINPKYIDADKTTGDLFVAHPNQTVDGETVNLTRLNAADGSRRWSIYLPGTTGRIAYRRFS